MTGDVFTSLCLQVETSFFHCHRLALMNSVAVLSLDFVYSCCFSVWIRHEQSSLWCLFIQGIPGLWCVWIYCPHCNFRITESLWLEETSSDLLAYPLPHAQKGPSIAGFSCALNVSRDEESTNSLGNPFQCLTTLKVKKCLLMFRLLLFFLIFSH